MNFFAEQERARRASRRLVVLFALAVLAIVAAVDAVLVGLFGIGRHADRVDPLVLLGISLVTAAVIALASAWRVASLAGGGGAVARGLGATPVPADTGDFAWKRLRNVVEEVAIASGVPVPELYVLEDEAGINAFAAGYTPADAAVCVTQGALDKLTRDELQGVVAHEFSHVLNGDMRLNVRLIGLLFGILVLGVAGRKILAGSGRTRGRGAGALVAFGLAILVIGYVGFFFGRLIQAAVSRSRECLADASAVQFTRQTGGIAGALKKIAALAEGSQLASAQREEVAHMLFGDGVGLSALFATHPPLLARIRALEPGFGDAEIARIARAWQQPVRAADADAPQASISGFAPAGATTAAVVPPGALPVATGAVGLDARGVAAQVGRPGADDFRTAAALHAQIPDALRAQARDPQSAPALVFALALGGDADTRMRQREAIARAFGAAAADAARALAEGVAALHPLLRLPLAQLAFPALRRRPRPELQRFLAALAALVNADGRVELDEYCLATLVRLQVVAALDPSRGFVPGSLRLADCAAELRDLCALVARYGHDDDAAARRAFLLAMHEALPDANPLFAYPDDWRPALDAALAKLARLAPEGKELVVRGLTRAIGEDGLVNVAEAELLRVVCAALHCPLPPLLATA
ncbi:MAG: M48 family metallopeptidase [Mizugakiibacter sp.]|uniref:M48 family metallopeptidase n=1 Tax=Mizugakiibacter sp. TaxID=1972610 RepID=UPI0031C87BB7|nr:M48 family metallopeptidase [Xanthomonadaceae bacterium]